MASGFAFAELSDATFEDWNAICGDDDGVSYSSYLKCNFVAVEDQMYQMQAPYVYVYLETTDQVALADTSSCTAQIGWDWNDDNTIKISASRDVYNHREGHFVSPARMKVRGRGRVLQLQFTSSPNLDFRLLGWGCYITKNTGP